MVGSDFCRGNELLRNGKAEEAIAAYQSAIAQNPSFHWSYYKLGKALEQLGRTDEASIAYRKATDLNPSCHQSIRRLDTNHKKKILIHIGTPKTGSTAIQESLNSAFNKNKNNILYVGRFHYFIAPLYYDNYQQLPREFRCKYSVSDFQNLKKEYKDKLFDLLRSHQNIIISSEYLSNFKIQQIERLRMDLDNLGDCEYQIVVYIREPASHYLSLVQQQLKASSSVQSPRNYHYQFMETVNLWSKIFSPEQLNIRIFNREMFPEGSVILDFQNCIEVFFNKEICLNLKTSTANESLSAEAMIILQKYRKFFYPNENNIFKKDSNNLILQLQNSKAEILQTQPKLLKKVVTYIRRRHEDDIRSLKSIYGIQFPTQDSENGDYSPKAGSKDPAINATAIEDVLENFDNNIVVNLLLWIVRKNFIF